MAGDNGELLQQEEGCESTHEEEEGEGYRYLGTGVGSYNRDGECVCDHQWMGGRDVFHEEEEWNALGREGVHMEGRSQVGRHVSSWMVGRVNKEGGRVEEKEEEESQKNARNAIATRQDRIRVSFFAFRIEAVETDVRAVGCIGIGIRTIDTEDLRKTEIDIGGVALSEIREDEKRASVYSKKEKRVVDCWQIYSAESSKRSTDKKTDGWRRAMLYREPGLDRST
ncbi:hypothetical protein R3P38DRAFT_3415655 [Favolaschia claudopus]|uniref:Uncharacterized protein n=1 Tax=Favolaschia claudopus TaxID=2862362 RepID=A0AAW0EG46_9AGAR